MEKILRLARANLRRHKKESLLLGVLILLCMMLMSAALPAERNLMRMFPALIERTETWQTTVSIYAKDFDRKCMRFLETDDRVADCEAYRLLFSESTRIPDENGKEQIYMTRLFTEENIRKYQIFTPESALTDAERAALPHPVYAPLREKQNLHLHEGGDFTLISGSKKFTFQIAGFYESGYTYSDSQQYVVSEADYAVLKNLFTDVVEIGFTAKNPAEDEAIADDFLQNCKDAGMDTQNAMTDLFRSKKDGFNIDLMFVLKIIEIMAVIILISVAVMIGYRIISDIRDQIVSIGVLEALGYRSAEIALSYTAEYFLIALAGCTAGTVCGFGLHAALLAIGERMKGCRAPHSLSVLLIAAVFLGITLIISLLAFRKARAVRKYPPVQAFRRGIGNHHFGKSHFPLRNTKDSVHLRLAVKGFADHTAQSIGLIFVMSITSFAVVLSFILYCFLGRGTALMNTIAGHEMSDIQIEVAVGTDMEAFTQALEAMPEIRKAVPSSSLGSIWIHAVREKKQLVADVYADYSQTENIFTLTGRFPQHGNEVMITKSVSAQSGLQTGDSILLSYDRIEREYIVTGIVSAFLNSDAVYLTEEGMQKLYPLYRPDSFQIYKQAGVDTDALRAELDRKFGKSAEQLGSADTQISGDYEARIRRRAEQVIAAMSEQFDATHVEYAIRSGDQIIAGDSSGMRIRLFLNLSESLSQAMEKFCTAVSMTTKLFMGISAFVVLMILSILMESEIRQQRKSLGIMKGMGYTAKELMLQLAFRIMPSALIAVVTGTVLGILTTRLLINSIGIVPVSLPAVLLLDAVLLAFCFACACFGARKIKQISVYELMTE